MLKLFLSYINTNHVNSSRNPLKLSFLLTTYKVVKKIKVETRTTNVKRYVMQKV